MCLRSETFQYQVAVRVEFYSKELNLADSSLSEEVLIQAMVENPKLMERPIVVANGKARIGRPPEQVLEIVG